MNNLEFRQGMWQKKESRLVEVIVLEFLSAGAILFVAWGAGVI